MTAIKFIKGDTFTSEWNSGSTEYTPIYAIIQGKKRLVRNIRHVLSGNTAAWRTQDYEQSVKEVEEAKNNLIKHKGNYITFYSPYDNPFELLNKIKECNYTLNGRMTLFNEAANGEYTDFHGNLCESSCAFFYRIYDKKVLVELKEIVSDMKQNIR